MKGIRELQDGRISGVMPALGLVGLRGERASPPLFSPLLWKAHEEVLSTHYSSKSGVSKC